MRLRKISFFCTLLLGVVLSAGLGLPRLAAGDVDLAPLYQVERSVERTFHRALGPIIEWGHDAKGRRMWAFRPFFFRYEDMSRKYLSIDFLYPLVTYRRHGKSSRWRGILDLKVVYDVNDPNSAWQYYWLPFYFRGRTPKGQKYFAIFPFGGTIREVFGYELIKFWLFPFYLKTVTNNITATHWLFPIYVSVKGPGVRKWHIFPLFGYARRDGKWQSTFFLWPLFTWGRNLDPDVKGRAWGLWPLYAHMYRRHLKKDEWFDNHTWLWPLFSVIRTHDAFQLHLPWPFFCYSRGMKGPGSSRLWFWPLWGRTKTSKARTEFWLWPLYLDQRQKSSTVYSRLRTIGLFWVQSISRNLKTGERKKATRFWPLLSSMSNSNGDRDFRMLHLYPLRNNKLIENNFAPLWTLYRFRASAKRFRHDLLWGLWQFQKLKGEHVEKHALFPLFSYKKSPDGKANRLNLLLGFFNKSNDGEGGKSYRFLWLVNRKYKNGRLAKHSFFPLYSRQKSPDGKSKSFNFLTGLYGSATKPDGSRTYKFLWIIRIKRKGKKR